MKRLITAILFGTVVGLSTPSYATVVAHPTGCPSRAFCGCGVSVKLFGHPVRNLFPARAYYRFKRTSPAAGMVAIFRGGRHVAYIERMIDSDTALLYDPNSGGHKTRIHERSIRGATIVDPHGNGATHELSASSRNHRRLVPSAATATVPRWGDNIH